MHMAPPPIPVTVALCELTMVLSWKPDMSSEFFTTVLYKTTNNELELTHILKHICYSDLMHI